MKRRSFVKAALGTAVASYLPSVQSLAAEISALTLTGRETTLSEAMLKEFSSALRGDVVLPGDTDYDHVRSAWNGAFDKRPALIARCHGAADVTEAVNFARSNELVTAVRAGGHSMAGKSVCEGGIVIDVSRMDGVGVDPSNHTARADAGVLLRGLDHEAQHFGLATTAGVVSHTGLAGLTLGGGLGRLQRKHGLTIDNLLGVNIVTADGKWQHASRDENADLFWGVRGGGGNFGIVTEFEYQLHTVGPTVLNVANVYPYEQVREMLEFYFEFMQDAPDDLYIGAGLINRDGGSPLAIISGCFFGDAKEADKLLQPLQSFGNPVVQNIGPINYAELQQRNDDNNPHGRKYYSKSGFFNDVGSDLINNLVDGFDRAVTPRTVVLVSPFGGAVGRVAPEDTAFYHRDAQFNIEVALSWEDADVSADNIEWGRDFWRDVAPFASRGFYVNTEMDPSESRLRQNYGSNYDRLVELKNKYDPNNMFRLNANIKPNA
jgi:FAD/FMN-containing dehydrogenase